MIRRTPRIDVDLRLLELHDLLMEPHTIGQLADKTGRTRKSVYKDIAKLVRRGFRLGSKLGIYWIEG